MSSCLLTTGFTQEIKNVTDLVMCDQPLLMIMHNLYLVNYLALDNLINPPSNKS